MKQDADYYENAALERLTPEEAEVVRSLSPSQLYAAYRLQEFAYRVEDAMQQVEDNHEELFEEGFFDKDDYREMAAEFFNRHDCNAAENDIWDDVIEDAIEAKEKKLAAKQSQKSGPRP